jgi:hypothetical protein
MRCSPSPARTARFRSGTRALGSFVNSFRKETRGPVAWRFIRSRSGHIIKLDDTDGSEKIEIIDKTGKNSIVIDSKENTITITTDKDFVLEAPQGKISLNAKELEMKSSAAFKMEAGSEMNIKASSTMNVKGATVNIN